MAYGLLITLSLVAAYLGLLWWLARTGRMERYNMSLLLGFILMIRTQRGRKALDVLARPRRFWNVFGDLGTGVTLVGMAAMTFLLLWTSILVLQPGAPVRPLEAREILVIPGINPFVPLWYGIIALIVTLVVHEGGHGILARANGMRVKSLGLLFAVVPIGAFVEPDEVELQAAGRRRRLRVFGAGPMINLVVAALTLAAFAGLFALAEPVEGAPLRGVVEDGPAHRAGIPPNAILTSVDARTLSTWDDLASYVDDSRRVGDTITLTDRGGATYSLRLESTWDQMEPAQREALMQEGPSRVEEVQSDPYMGVRPFVHDLDGAFLADPFGSTTRGGATIPNILFLMSLPIGEVSGAPYLSVYVPDFYEAPNPALVIGMLLMFWIFWINLMVGLTNILPMLPFDGGHIFRDAFGAVLGRLRPRLEPARRERIIGRTASAVSITILIGILATIIGPRLV